MAATKPRFLYYGSVRNKQMDSAGTIGLLIRNNSTVADPVMVEIHYARGTGKTDAYEFLHGRCTYVSGGRAIGTDDAAETKVSQDTQQPASDSRVELYTVEPLAQGSVAVVSGRQRIATPGGIADLATADFPRLKVRPGESYYLEVIPGADNDVANFDLRWVEELAPAAAAGLH